MGRPVVVTTRTGGELVGAHEQTRLEDDEVDPLRGEEREEHDSAAGLRSRTEVLRGSVAHEREHDHESDHEDDAVTDDEVDHVRERPAGGAGETIVEDNVLGRLDRDVGVERRGHC